MPFPMTDDGVKLYYEDAGAGTPIVFVQNSPPITGHGKSQLRYFGQRYRCIAFNRPRLHTFRCARRP